MAGRSVVVGMERWVPVLAWARQYERAWLRHDVLAGLVLTALLVPQGMAYAQLAGLPPITGLYTSIMCLVAYAVFGPSRVLVLGPDSSLGPMIAATVLPLVAADGDPARAVLLASVLSVLVGLFMIAAGTAKLGFVADLLSKPTQIGYLNGLALTILVGQLPKVFGFSVDADGLVGEAAAFGRALADGRTVPAALAVGLGAFAVIMVFQKALPRIPAVLVAVVVSIAVVSLADLQAHGVKVVGPLPQGFPPLTLPLVSPSDAALLVAGALGITLVALADTISTAAAFARRQGVDVDGNAEMVGIGTANVLAGFFQGFPVSTSSSRTAVAFRVGARSQVTGLVGAAAILVLLVATPNLLRDLPTPTLGAIVLAACLSLADVAGVRRLWRQRPTECVLSLAATLGVAVLGVLPGIAVAVGLSILNVFRRAWWPYQTVVGDVPGVPGYHEIGQYPNARVLPGAVIFRFDAPLFFANARTFAEQIDRLAAAEPRPRWIIIAAEPITDIDTTAADMLVDLDLRLNAAGQHLIFAELKHLVREKLDRYGLADTIEPGHFFPSVTAATKAYRARYGLDWVPARDLSHPG